MPMAAKKPIQPKPRKAGRPPLPEGNAKATMLRVRVTPDERAALEAAAKASNQTISEWIRSTLNAAIQS
jgi:predicted HicB family RNase H-like nuclease